MIHFILVEALALPVDISGGTKKILYIYYIFIFYVFILKKKSESAVGGSGGLALMVSDAVEAVVTVVASAGLSLFLG